MSDALLKDTQSRMEKTEQSLRRELAGIRAGNASPSLLNRINVEYYGVPTPLNQLAQISVPEPRLLMVTPYDKGIIADIERAINQSDLGITPANDGNVIRLAIPALSEERRKEIAKQVGKEAESAKISVRNIRRDAMDQLKKEEKSGEIREDDLRSYEKDVQNLTDKSVANIDGIAAEKEAEILEV